MYPPNSVIVMCFLPFLSYYQGQQEQQTRIYKATVPTSALNREEKKAFEQKSGLSRKPQGHKASQRALKLRSEETVSKSHTEKGSIALVN